VSKQQKSTRSPAIMPVEMSYSPGGRSLIEFAPFST
jgi:hypothetical protein